MKCSKLKSKKPCSADYIVKYFTANSVCDKDSFVRRYTEGDRTFTVLITEEYYFRNNSTLSVTVIIDEQPHQTTVEIVSNGGKVGIFQVSYGAEGSALNKMKFALKQLGFVEA